MIIFLVVVVFVVVVTQYIKKKLVAKWGLDPSPLRSWLPVMMCGLECCANWPPGLLVCRRIGKLERSYSIGDRAKENKFG